MTDITINYMAVLVAAVVNMVIGYLWYGPVFGKRWQKLMGFTHEQLEAMRKKSMGTSYALLFVVSVVMAYVLAYFLGATGAYDTFGAVQLAFWIWLGFIATVMLGTVLWEGKSWQLYMLNVSYYLVTLAAMAKILVWWR